MDAGWMSKFNASAIIGNLGAPLDMDEESVISYAPKQFQARDADTMETGSSRPDTVSAASV